MKNSSSGNSFVNIMSNTEYTENGALSYKSTGSSLIDLFFHLPSMRNEKNEQRITNLFDSAFAEDKQTTLRILFYTRDCRGGQGERKIFRVLLRHLAKKKPDWVARNCHLVAEFGRWDDLLSLIDLDDSIVNKKGVKVKDIVITFISKQIKKDLKYLKDNKLTSLSLLGKWMPSLNASSNKTKYLAKILLDASIKINLDIGQTPKEYRQKLSLLRNALNIVERNITEKKYENIDYSKLPSYAALKYRKAFRRNDDDRYTNYIESLKNGEAKINAGTLYPYDLVRPYISDNEFVLDDELYDFLLDPTIEEQWKALPDYVPNINGLVVCDTSMSMTCNNCLPLQTSMSLALYISERNKSEVWKNYCIPFSSKASWIKIEGNTLLQKLHSIYTGDCSDTNIQSVFDLILGRAVAEHVSPTDMPKILLIISDMQFNPTGEFDNFGFQETNYEQIKRKYVSAGYDLPKLIWWNVASRRNEFPTTFKDINSILLSGSSPSILEIALSGHYDMQKTMEEIVNREKYQTIKI